MYYLSLKNKIQNRALSIAHKLKFLEECANFVQER